jgi:DNA invertase Pin-like site-specific DNA recombinase
MANGQNPETQLAELRPYAELRGWTLVGEYVDEGVSGAREKRPALDRLMQDVRKRRVDVIFVWALDRLGRSLRHLVNLGAELEALGVDLVCFTQPIDTTTPAGKFTFQVLAAVSEFERQMIRARVRAGVARARASGKKLGRPMKTLDLIRARELLNGGNSLRAVARALGIHHNTLARALGVKREGGSISSPKTAVIAQGATTS